MSWANGSFGSSKDSVWGASLSAVKGFLLFLVLGSFQVIAYANEPGAVALSFLEKVRKGDLSLEPGRDTAIQPDTAEEKLKAIRKGITRLGADLREGELELGEVREDDGFAAVMVRKVSGFDSTDSQVYPVALVKSGADWLPAPVLASYENSVAAYTVPIRDRLSNLEEWMMKKRVVDLGNLIAESSKRTRERIRGSMVGENLKGDDLGAIAQAFLKACAARDRSAILGFMGGLGEPLPDDWASRLAVSRAAVEGQGPWRLLVAPDVVRVPVHEERTKDSGMISIACLDPAIGGSTETSKKIRLINIEMEKDDSGLWRMDLPSALMSGDENLLTDDIDQDLLDLFPERLRELDPQINEGTARAALDGMMGSLRSPSLRDLLRRVNFGKSGKDARIACAEAAKIWWTLNEPGALRVPLELGFKEKGASAVAVFQWFSVADADRYDPITLYFRKSGEGWNWCPGIVSADDTEDLQALSKWAKENEPGWRQTWRAELMKPGTALDKFEFTSVATDEEVSSLMAGWMDALERKEMRHALSLTAWLGGAKEIPMKALRNLSYDLSNYKKGDWKVEGIHRSSSWVAASVRQIVGGKVRNAFIPVVITGSGPRLVPEIDLCAEDTRTRSFLNEASFGRIGEFASKERLEEIRGLFAEFKKSLIKEK